MPPVQSFASFLLHFLYKIKQPWGAPKRSQETFGQKEFYSLVAVFAYGDEIVGGRSQHLRSLSVSRHKASFEKRRQMR